VKKTIAKKSPAKQVSTKKTPVKKKSPTKKATAKKAPAKKPTLAKKSPAKKPSAKRSPAKKASDKKTSKKKTTVDQFEFAEILSRVCRVLILCSKTTMNDDSSITFCLTEKEDFTAAAQVLKLLPEACRTPLMEMAKQYQERIAELFDEDDEFPLGHEDEDEDESDDDDEAERTAAVLKEYAEELEEDDDYDSPLGNEFMEVEHFLPFKQLFTVAEAASLIGSYQEGGKLDKAMQAAIESIDAEDDSSDEDEDFDDDEDLEEDEDDDDDDEDQYDWKEN